MQIQWFPGHMKKTLDQVTKDVKLVDAVVMMLDARCPLACENPLITDIVKRKPIIYCLNKSDLSDARVTALWKRDYINRGNYFAICDSKLGKVDDLIKQVKKAVKEDRELKAQSRGDRSQQPDAPERREKSIRLMVLGIPNVGKSTLINRMAGKNVCRMGDRPGVTRGKQWIRLRDDIELMDTPGVLWHKFEDKETGTLLALTGAIKDEIVDQTDLSLELLTRLLDSYPKALELRYGLTFDGNTASEALEMIGRRRGMLIKGGEIDVERTSRLVMDEFRSGLLGRISLQSPDIPDDETA